MAVDSWGRWRIRPTPTMFSLPDECSGPSKPSARLLAGPWTCLSQLTGLVGSSPAAFGRVAAFVVLLLDLDLSEPFDDALWEAWEWS